MSMASRNLTLGSLFSGIGGFELAGALNEIAPLWASEIEPAPISITKRHFPSIKHLGDVTRINGAEIEPVNIITGGFPCQDLSQAGKQVGLAGARSGLFHEAIRIIKEMRSASNGEYPRFIVYENVPGMFASNNGEDFRTVLQETASICESGVTIPRPPQEDGGRLVWEPAGAIMGDDWSLAWRCMDSQYWGVPQRRNRVFLVADLTGRRAAEVLFKPNGLQGHPTKICKQEENPSKGVMDSVRESVYDEVEKNNGELIILDDQGGSYISIKNDDVSPTLRHQMKGYEPLIFDARGNGDGRVVNTLTGDHNNRITNYTSVLCMAPRPRSQSIIKDKSLPILGTDYKGVNCVYCIQGNTIERSDSAGANGKGVNKDISFTLTGMDRHAVFNATSQNSVRRLTPLECERLMGFPDFWTLLRHDGKEILDSARYKALGNSVVIPCVSFILGRIREALENEPVR